MVTHSGGFPGYGSTMRWLPPPRRSAGDQRHRRDPRQQPDTGRRLYLALRSFRDARDAAGRAGAAYEPGLLALREGPLLEAAVEGNIVADFPLCNKSFNCSYSGHDL